MRATVIWPLLVVLATAQRHDWDDNSWVEEDPEEGFYEKEPHEHHQRFRRDIQYDPYEEHIRVKRRCDDEYRERRSADYVRRPRQVHQYEVHEFTDEGSQPSSPPYEEMLAEAAEHYHKVYVGPGAPAASRYLHPDVSGGPVPVTVFRQPVQYQPPPKAPVYYENVPPKSDQVNYANVPVNVVPVSVPSNVASAPVSGPIPVSFVPISQPLQKLADDDQSVAGAHHHHHHQNKHAHGHAQGGGHKNAAHHHKSHDGKSVKGFHTDHHVDKGGKGHKTDEVHRKEYEEALGKKHKHHDHADHKGSHEEEAHGHRGSKFDEKKGHKKGHKTKGYHNKYHKDEFHKEHKFYDDFHKSGEHHRFGKFNAKHASNESGKKKAHHVNAGHDYVERGKKGYSNKGHLDSDHKGHKGKHGHEEHHQHHEEHGKKGGHEDGKHWGYKKN